MQLLNVIYEYLSVLSFDLASQSIEKTSKEQTTEVKEAAKNRRSVSWHRCSLYSSSYWLLHI